MAEYSIEGLFTDTNYVPFHFTFGGKSLSVSALNAASTDFDRTGFVIWPSARILGMFVQEILKARNVGIKNVLELGAGAGLSGLVAALLSPKSRVVITDGDESLVDLVGRNAEANNLHNVIPRPFFWGKENAQELLQSMPDMSHFDLILAADCVYREAWIRPLIDSCVHLLGQGLKRDEFEFEICNGKVKLSAPCAVLVFQSRSTQTESKFREYVTSIDHLVLNELQFKRSDFHDLGIDESEESESSSETETEADSDVFWLWTLSLS